MSNLDLNVDILTGEIAKLVDKYSKDESVECIYFLPYVEETERNLNLVVVSNKDGLYSKGNYEQDNLNRKYSKMHDEIGGNLMLTFDKSENYSPCAMHVAEVSRVRDLLSSIIFFDRNGNYYKIAHQFDRYNTIEKYPNIINMDIQDNKQLKLK